MTFNELTAWIIAKPFGRILIEHSETKKSVVFFLSCKGLDGQIYGIERDVSRYDLVMLKDSLDYHLGSIFDDIVRQFDAICQPVTIEASNGAT
jgi:hypothetical protein